MNTLPRVGRLLAILTVLTVQTACGDGRRIVDSGEGLDGAPDAVADGSTDGATDGCIPTTCTDRCGVVDDGCGGTRDCGPCDGSCIRSIAAAVDRTCAVNRAGMVQCWGDNAQGATGQATSVTSHHEPRVVAEIPDAAQLALGDAHGCARLEGGRVACWGDNRVGQLGSLDSTSRAEARFVGLLTDVVDVAASANQTCGLLGVDGTVWCWGGNENGEVGPSAAPTQNVPARVEGVNGATAIAVAESFSAALLSDGRVSVWGRVFPFVPPQAPSIYVPFEGIVAIAASRTRLAALDSSGTVAFLGPDTWEPAFGVEAVSAVGDGFCLQLLGGEVQCRGDGSRGVFGAVSDFSTFTTATALEGATSITGSTSHACGVRDGALHCWGSNEAGQLGVPASTSIAPPAEVAFPCDVPCAARGCAFVGASCGAVPDGCGGDVSCGGCTAPETCGGGGIDNRCGAPCMPLTCTGLGATCGAPDDGCGGTLACGTCGTDERCFVTFCDCMTDWTSRESVSSNTATGIDAVEDAAGLHVAFQRTGMRYAFRNTSGTWTEQMIAPFAANSVQIVSHPTEGLHVTYLNLGGLHHAVPDGAGGWTIDTPFPSAGGFVHATELLDDGTLLVVYSDGGLREGRRAPTTGAWTTSQISSETSHSEVAIARAGSELHIAFGFGARVGYGVFRSGSWTLEPDIGRGGRANVIAVGGGVVHIATIDDATDEVLHYRRPASSTGSFLVETLPDVPRSSSLAMGVAPDGTPELVYPITSSSRGQTRFTRYVSGNWVLHAPVSGIDRGPHALLRDGATIHLFGSNPSGLGYLRTTCL